MDEIRVQEYTDTKDTYNQYYTLIIIIIIIIYFTIGLSKFGRYQTPKHSGSMSQVVLTPIGDNFSFNFEDKAVNSSSPALIVSPGLKSRIRIKIFYNDV